MTRSAWNENRVPTNFAETHAFYSPLVRIIAKDEECIQKVWTHLWSIKIWAKFDPAKGNFHQFLSVCAYRSARQRDTLSDRYEVLMGDLPEVEDGRLDAQARLEAREDEQALSDSDRDVQWHAARAAGLAANARRDGVGNLGAKKFRLFLATMGYTQKDFAAGIRRLPAVVNYWATGHRVPDWDGRLAVRDAAGVPITDWEVAA